MPTLYAITYALLAPTVATLAANVPRLLVLTVDMLMLPFASGHLWSAFLVVAVWGATGWGIQSPQQYRLVSMAPSIAPILLGLNTAATYLGVTAAGIVGALTIHVLGAQALSLISAGIFVLAVFASRQAQTALAARSAASAAASTPSAP